ncbi:MAG: tetratricopeptide repeat protein [Thainema sp.]
MVKHKDNETESIDLILINFIPENLKHLVQNFSLDLGKKSRYKVCHWVALKSHIKEINFEIFRYQEIKNLNHIFEACYHARALHNWDLVHILMCLPIGKNKTEFHQRIGEQGEYFKQIELYKTAYNQINTDFDLICLDGLGQAYRISGNYDEALKCHKKQLKLAQEIADINHKMLAHRGLGKIHYDQHAYRLSLDHFKKQYSYSQICSDVEQQIDALCRIGRAYININRNNRGIKHIRTALKLAVTLDSKSIESIVLSELAYGYFWGGNPDTAIEYTKNLINYLSLEDNPKSYFNTIRNLGQIYIYKNDVNKANFYLNKALDISQNLNDRYMRFMILMDLALLHNQCQHRSDLSILFAEEALLISYQFGLTVCIAHCHSYLSIFHADLGQIKQAHEHIQKATYLYKNSSELANPEERLILQACLGKFYWISGQKFKGVLAVIYGLIVCPPWKYLNSRWILREMLITVVPLFNQAKK